MPPEESVGIDLGTTNSAVAWMDRSGRSAMVPGGEGELLTPSVVLFGDAEVVVGKEAASATGAHPDRVAQWVKRDMGSPKYSRPIRGEYLPPEVIQACILRKLGTDMVTALGPECRVVITVPAYFDEPRRKATADAGEMAGLQVLDIVNEPTAAALAFGETAGYLSISGAPKAEMTVLVYDLGGGTFDATLLKLAPANIQTVATDGDVRLGGHDWDERLVDHVAEAFQKLHHVDLRRDPGGLNRLYNAVIDAKHTLSARNRATVRVEHQGKACQVRITREQFEELTADLLERTAYTTRRLVADAKMQWKNVSRVLLVGGSTRMPMVSEMLKELTGITPDHTVNPDEAVARGAALYAGYLLAGQAEGSSQPTLGQPGGGKLPPQALTVTNVNAHNLGVEGIDQETLRKTNVVLIPRNTPLPATFAERFVTKSENQRSIAIRILEGESSIPGECTAIGRTVIRDLPSGLPKGWPVEVTFQYGANGRLSVRAVVPGTHRQTALDLDRTVGLSSEGIARWKAPVASSAGFDVFESMVEEVLGSLEPGAAATSATGNPATSCGDCWSADPHPAGPLPAAAAVQEQERPVDNRAAAPQPAKPTPGPATSRWVVALIGYVTSAVVGLALGYLVLSWLRPERFPWPW